MWVSKLQTFLKSWVVYSKICFKAHFTTAVLELWGVWDQKRTLKSFDLPKSWASKFRQVLTTLMKLCFFVVECTDKGRLCHRKHIKYVYSQQTSARSDISCWQQQLEPEWNAKLQNCEADAQEYWASWLLRMFMQSLAYFYEPNCTYHIL